MLVVVLNGLKVKDVHGDVTVSGRSLRFNVTPPHPVVTSVKEAGSMDSPESRFWIWKLEEETNQSEVEKVD